MPDPSRAGRRRPAPGRLTNRETMTTSDLTRRSVVQGAAAVGLGAVAVGTLAACGSSTPAPAAASPSSSAGSTPSGSAASGTTVAKADVPVGGGKVVDQVVGRAAGRADDCPGGDDQRERGGAARHLGR